jgi:hypothetical protein
MSADDSSRPVAPAGASAGTGAATRVALWLGSAVGASAWAWRS